ncbi:hypothetical protein M3765_02310 [Streptomyces thermoviolaceus]|uniref:hypothetical protein n=1 Tax=Streptomyces thermoviolaceus TaxID=1952 RepID=UPI002041627C|nr:hypothetical protein [Streptomyces thermoviolaceus]MCM3262887.1 hypothetical protein [Streptomyces thermoviolaceus]
MTVAEIFGPLVLTGPIVCWGVGGWIALAVVFVTVSAVMRPVVLRGGRLRDEATRREEGARGGAEGEGEGCG